MKKILLVTALSFSFSTQAEDLSQVFNLAVENDAQIKVAIANRNSTYQAKPLARAGILPNVSLNASAGRFNTDGSSDDSYGNRDLSISLVQPLYRRDRFIQIDQADETIKQADADYALAEQDLIIRTITAYFDVLSAQDDLKFIRANLKAIDRQLDQAQQRFEVGLIAITGVHEAQARYDQARADEITALNSLSTTWEALYEIIHARPTTLATVNTAISLLPPAPNEISDWSGMAIKNSPSLTAAKHATEVARQEVERQRSGHYPTLDLVASYKSTDTSSNFSSDTDTGSIILQGEIPLYAGGGVVASTKQAQYNYQSTLETQDQIRRSIDKQVRDAFRGVHTNISRVNALKAAVASSQSALDATSAGFDVGTRTLVDVLDSQQALYRSQRDYIGAYYSYILQHMRLKQVAGVLNQDDLQDVNALLIATP